MIRELKRQLDRYALNSVVGTVRIFSFDPKTGLITKMVQSHNDVLYEGADIMAHLLRGESDYAVTTMYLEFKNLAVPGDPITPPTFDRTGGTSYYNTLGSSPDIDFVRVPLLITPELSASGDNYEGNQLTFFGQSEGTIGFHGKAFSPAANSTVFGAALVAAPTPNDQSGDRIWSRTYSVGDIAKQAGQEIGVTWVVRFN